jgi:hypothetical protein
MNFLSIATIVEVMCGSGTLDAALEAGELFAEQANREEDRATGADGGRMRWRYAPASVVAEHSRLAPRSAFCRRRMCRSTR